LSVLPAIPTRRLLTRTVLKNVRLTHESITKYLN
jgi:hypothetical protein